MNGEVLCATAIAALFGEKATALPILPVGNVEGSANFVPNPEPDHGYALMNGVAAYETAIAVPSKEKATP
jgi:hypothetical protein